MISRKAGRVRGDLKLTEQTGHVWLSLVAGARSTSPLPSDSPPSPSSDSSPSPSTAASANFFIPSSSLLKPSSGERSSSIALSTSEPPSDMARLGGFTSAFDLVFDFDGERSRNCTRWKAERVSCGQASRSEDDLTVMN